MKSPSCEGVPDETGGKKETKENDTAENDAHKKQGKSEQFEEFGVI